MNVTDFYPIFLQSSKIVTDSRNVIPGSIFAGIRGEQFNGNSFVKQAFEKGAGYALIDDPDFAIDSRCILVPDTLKFLQDLARYHRRKFNIPVLAITGTNGKTTTKELMARVLSSSFKVHYTQGNLNNHIGVPLTLLAMPVGTEMAVIEMGANHPGEIDFLCRIAEPTHGLITNVGKAHLEGFGSFEGVVQTKTELYRYLDNRGGTVFINSGQEPLVQQAGTLKCEKIRYGQNETDFYRSGNIKSNPMLSLQLLPALHTTQPEWQNLHTQLIGNYNADNVLAAACIGWYFGIDSRLIRESLESYTPQNNRSQLRKTHAHTLILDYYNANPTSMKVAIENFIQMEAGSKVLILGDMFELGSYTEAEHRSIVELLLEWKLKPVFLIGPEFCKAAGSAPSFTCFEKTEDFTTYLMEHPVPPSTILIKGSRGMKLEKVVDAFTA